MVVVSARRWEQVLLLLPLLFGVAAMHSTVAPFACSAGSAGAPTPIMAISSMIEPPGPPVTGVDATDTRLGTAAGHDENGGHHGGLPGHVLGHLCVAVLGATMLLALALAAMILFVGRATDVPARRAAGIRLEWARPPPRTAVRLAQLCVMRN